MKKIYLTSALALLSLGAGAQSYDFLTFCPEGKAQVSLPVDGLKLRVEGSQLVAEAGGSRTAFDLPSLRAMFFATESTTGIAAAPGRDETAATLRDGRICVTAPAGSRVAVLTPDGRTVARLTKRADGSETLGPVPAAGVYLVNVNGRTFKLLAQ